MNSFKVLLRVKIIAATSIVSISTIFSLPAISQEVENNTQAAPIESVEKESNEKVSTTAISAKDPAISILMLEILIQPLLQEQVKAEADAWFVLLQKKAQEISDIEVKIATLESKGQIGGAVNTDKEKLVVQATKLKTEESSIANRFDKVLDALDKKGGDTSSYRQYLDAVSELEFDITDAGELSLRFTTWLTSPEGGISLGLDLLKFGGILIASLIIAPRAGKLANSALTRVSNISTLFRDFAVIVVKRSVLVIGGLLALAVIGVDLGPILAVVGGASFVLAFALQSNLGNFASGLMLLVSKPFDVGDEVNVAGYWAIIDSISLANTKLRDFSGNLITLPNNSVWDGDIINYTHTDMRKVKLGINIKFSQDVDQIKKLWTDIASSHPKVLKNPSPSIFPWNATYDYHISVGLSAWSTTEDYWSVYVDLLKSLQKKLEEQNIELAAPIQEIKLSQSGDPINTKKLTPGDVVLTN